MLSSVRVKPSRSHLEIRRSHGRVAKPGLHLQDIAAILADKCQFHTSKTAVNNFPWARARNWRNASRRMSRSGSVPTSVVPEPDFARRARTNREPRPTKNRSTEGSQAVHKPPDNGFYFAQPNRSA
jgi:hypothetical protein